MIWFLHVKIDGYILVTMFQMQYLMSKQKILALISCPVSNWGMLRYVTGVLGLTRPIAEVTGEGDELDALLGPA